MNTESERKFNSMNQE